MNNAHRKETPLTAARRLMSALPNRLTSGIVAGFMLIFISVVVSNSSGAFSQVPNSRLRAKATQISHVSKILSVPSGNGSVQNLVVDVDDWAFRTGDTEFELPGSGAVIIIARDARISAVIGGVANTHNAGDYWTVPGGTHMTISIRRPQQGAGVRTISAALKS